MDKIDKKITNFLLELGLSEEQTKIYLTLTKRGVLTTLELSRATSINRTRVYRLLEKLKLMGLVEEVIDEYRRKAKAVEADRLELLVKEQEAKAKFLRDVFPTVSSILLGRNRLSQPGTKVLFYRGKDGIRQLVWNTLRAENEVVGYSYRPLEELIGDYYRKWFEEWQRRKLTMRDLYSDEYLRAKKKGAMDSLDYSIKGIQSRYVSAKILDINHQVDIYNDVVSYYNWHEGEVFGVEIYNEKIAEMQKQLFEIVWKMGVDSAPSSPLVNPAGSF